MLLLAREVQSLSLKTTAYIPSEHEQIVLLGLEPNYTHTHVTRFIRQVLENSRGSHNGVIR